MTEQELIDSAKSGNEDSFIKLIDNCSAKLKASIFKSYKLSMEDFKDAMQIAMVKAWQKLETFRGDSAFSTWFYTVLRNEVLNILNQRNKINKHEVSTTSVASQNDIVNSSDYDFIILNRQNKSTYFDINPTEVVCDTAQTILEKKEDVKKYKELVDSTLEKLKPSHSQIIRMIFEDGKSYKEVANELSMPIGTVMSRLFYARKHAKKLLMQYATRNNISLNKLFTI